MTHWLTLPTKIDRKFPLHDAENGTESFMTDDAGRV